MNKLKLVKTSKELALQRKRQEKSEDSDQAPKQQQLHITEPPSIVASEAGNLKLVVPQTSTDHNQLIVSEPVARRKPRNPVKVLDEDGYARKLKKIIESGGDTTAFQQKHTTEDNASFQQLIQVDNARRELKTADRFSTTKLDNDWDKPNPKSALFFRPKDIPQEPSHRGEIAVENTIVVKENIEVEDPKKKSEQMADEIIAAVKGPNVDGYPFVTKNTYKIAPESKESMLLRKLTAKKTAKVAGDVTPRGDLSPAGRNLLNKISKRRR
ncbi:hypothetical protein CJU90_5468 [Yarrowia sp. C11]|nr:hypothetical protein CJU90_5468 [Yarrowia sp. C11]KAG5364059.1 hypothetical protein CKK34_2847 [Yarrowia sp. E02]